MHTRIVFCDNFTFDIVDEKKCELNWLLFTCIFIRRVMIERPNRGCTILQHGRKSKA